MKIHFIAIGGSAMHNLAIALHKKGYTVSGSDDEIFEPSKSRLQKYGLLPRHEGWNPGCIHAGLDAIILGMHARADNPELARAKELGLKIYSYPEFIYEQSKDKRRIVIGGSHGKTTITSMVLHAASLNGVDCDYLVGAQLEGFEVMVKLSDEATFIVIEGDEYLTSPIDPRPKFHVYQPDIALISGIAWDHINVFPTFENYIEQFRIFAGLVPENGKLIYCGGDDEIIRMVHSLPSRIPKIPYKLPDFRIIDGITVIHSEGHIFPLKIFGEHNLYNLSGAMLICHEMGIGDHAFLSAISSFKGASRRLEILGSNESVTVFRDFAHAPSKLKATTNAVKQQYPEKKLFAFLELHTFSSLNAKFLGEYRNCMASADIPVVYFNPHTLQMKKLPEISVQMVADAFNSNGLKVFTNSSEMLEFLHSQELSNSVVLFMSSGNFDGQNLPEVAAKILDKSKD